MRPEQMDSLSNDAEIIIAVRTGNIGRLNRRLARLAEEQRAAKNAPSARNAPPLRPTDKLTI